MTKPKLERMQMLQVGSKLAKQRHVAVVGAGAAGLVAARELRKEGHQVTVFERGEQVGGTWVYKEDPVQHDHFQIHSSLYDSLRVNLPREIMGYSDFPLDIKTMKNSSRDNRRYCSHKEVLTYLQNFAAYFDLLELIKFDTLVDSASRVEFDQGKTSKWKLRLRNRHVEDVAEELFDALVVCNGHFEISKVPSLEGIKEFKGDQIHSKDYKGNHTYKGKRVLVVGTGPSGDDISKEVAEVASVVYWSGRLFSRIDEAKKSHFRMSVSENTMLKSNVSKLENATVFFEADAEVEVDAIIWCTGYEYSVPFLQNKVVHTDKGRIEPLFQHLFAPEFAPYLSFIGLGFRILPFPFFEIQSKWVAKCLSGTCSLPSSEEMLDSALAMYDEIEQSGIAKEMTHCMDGLQWDYLKYIVNQEGMDCDPLPDWKIELYEINREKKKAYPSSYRDLTLDSEIPLMQHVHTEGTCSPL